mgnify:CR=1 FL=1
MQNQLRTTENRQAPMARRNQGHTFGSLWNMFDAPYGDLQNMEPKIEVSENKNNVMVTAELPGVNENDIDLEISTNGYLTISGEKRHENTDTANGGYFSEIFYGHVSRTIPLPWDLDYAKAAAEYDNGILTVSIPKTNLEQNSRKKISVGKAKKNNKRMNNKRKA